MEWRVEEDKETGIIWIEDEYARTICDFYFKNEQGGGLEENFYIFDNAKTNAKLIAKAPHQQALIDELVGEHRAWAKNIGSAFIRVLQKDYEEIDILAKNTELEWIDGEPHIKSEAIAKANREATNG